MWGFHVTVGLLVFAVTAVAYWIWDRRQRLSQLKKLGIPGPTPDLFRGNFTELQEKGFHKSLKEWRQKYGKTFGYYEFDRPVLVTSDADILQQITVKQFSKFHARKAIRFADNKKFMNMLSARGDRWKKLRSIGSQMFLTRRMKEMTPLIAAIMDRVMSIFEEKEKAGEAFNIHEVFQGMTLEVIKNVAFGIQSNALFEPNDPFLTHCRQIFKMQEKRPMSFKVLGLITAFMPGILGLALPIVNSLMGNLNDWFHETAKVIIQDRMKQGSKRKDFIQLMLDVRQADEIRESDLTAVEDGDSTFSPRVTRKNDILKFERNAENGAQETTKRQMGSNSEAGKLTMEEMQAQCMLFLLAGYETSSTALGYLAYDLAMNPKIQDLLQKEIDEHFPQENVRPDYESVQHIPYMDLVVKESLRLHTIGAVAITRCTMEETTVTSADFPDGLTLPEGLVIQINPEDVHLDPEHWGPEDPLSFVPERFDPERVKNRHKMAWLPFGQGPRNCVGMRFALMEIKMMLVRLLKAYNIEKTDRTPEKLPTTRSSVQSPSEGVIIRLVKRNGAPKEK